MRIGIDLGGHTLIVARIAMNAALPVIDRCISQETPPGRSVRNVMMAMAETIAAFCADCEVESVGIALPGMMDADRHHARKMPNFPPEWDDLDVSAALAAALAAHGVALPIAIENDANCYALGEGLAGEAINMKNYVVLTMGTGIGSGIVVDGRLLIGAHGLAGEAGHAIVCGDLPCGCGGCGHAETWAAADGTAARARARGLPEDFRALWGMRDDLRAQYVLDETLDAMARAIATIYHILDPEIVIIGGGMSLAAGLRGALHERTIPYLSRPFKPMLDLRISKLGNHAALYGAASL